MHTNFPFKRGKALVLSGLFVALLCMPTLDLVFHLDKNPVRAREPIPFPTLELKLESLKKFPGALEWYLRNTMGFQGTLLRINGLFKYYALGVASTPTVTIGKDDWLFMESDLRDYRHVIPFTREELDKWVETIAARKRFLDARGIHYALVVCPDKEMIYDEYLPSWIERADAPSRIEQFTQAVRERLGVEVLDLTDTLRARKTRERLYHKTDTHWNDLGAYVAYEELTTLLSRHYPALKPIPRSEWTERKEVLPGGDLARMIGLKLDLHEELVWLRYPKAQARTSEGKAIPAQSLDITETLRLDTVSPRAEIPSALFVRDSFGDALLPMLAEHIGKAKWLWTYYKFPASDIDAMRPSLVVEQFVGRTLADEKPVNPPELDGLAQPGSAKLATP